MTYSNKKGDTTQAYMNNQLREAHKELQEEGKHLTDQIRELGYKDLTIQEFLEIKPDLKKGQKKASQTAALQDKCQKLLQRKKDLDNTIIIEPSRLPAIVDAAEKILINNRECNIYQRAGKLVHITKIGKISQRKKNKLKRPNDAIVIREVDQAFLTVLLTKIGHFKKVDGRSNEIKKIDCPERISRYLIAKQSWNLPILTGIINAPTLRADGSILDTPGYDTESGILFIPDAWNFEKIPQEPTHEDAKKALCKIEYILKEFPFEDDASKSVIIAAMLTALIRKSISTAPLFGITAPKMASGKSLLADAISLIAIGKENSVIAQAENEAEEKKRIMSILMNGDPIVCYDNIEKPFGSAPLCAVLTQLEYKDRILGGNETRTVPTNTTFLATGNNLVFIGDTSTRTLLCKLDPRVERPEERSFDLILCEYIPENRSQLVKACLTILRAYHLADRPKKEGIKQFGRFEEWSNWIRGAIIWVGLADPCETRKEIENADPIRMLLGNLLYSWYKIFCNKSVKTRTVISTAMKRLDEDHEVLLESIKELLPNKRGEISNVAFAKKLVSFKGRIENGYRLEHMGTYQGTALWSVKKLQK